MIAIYARQSVDKPGSISIETQLTICRNMAHCEGEIIEFVDAGFSGKDLKRPALTRLIQEIRQKRIRVVYVYKLDRISRSIVDFSNLIELFQRHDVRFVSCTELFDTSTPMGRAMLSMAATFAQLERETISQRVADVYREKARKGLYMGGRVPFGYRVEHHRYEIVPKEAKIVRILFDMYIEEGESYQTISNWLEINGIRTRAGNNFFPARIGEILKNPIYVQCSAKVLAYGISQGYQVIELPNKAKNNGLFQYNMDGTKVWVVANHEGFINDCVWLEVQKKRGERFGEALRLTQEKLNAKNYYAFNPEIDK